MENKVNEFLVALNQKIDGIYPENPFHMADQSLKIAQDAREKLDLAVTHYSFSSQEEEIHYFKYLHPTIYRALNYYFELYHLEANKPLTGNKRTQRYLKGILKTYQRYFHNNQDLYDYYRLKKTDLDTTYFTSQPENTALASQDPVTAPADKHKVLSIYANITARLQALEQLTADILRDIDALNSQSLARPGEQSSKLTWTDTKTALIELGYALQSSGAFNNGNAPIKKVMTVLQETFQIDVGNYYGSFQSNMRIRRGTRTIYLDRLKVDLEKKMDECDENPRFH